MKEEILSNLDNPAHLERLYRNDKSNFKRTFQGMYPELKDNSLVRFWNERLNFSKDEVSFGSRKEIFLVIIASFLAAMIAKLPAILSIPEEWYYPRNAGFIVFPLLSAYFVWKNKLSAGKVGFIAAATLLGLVFINLLPDIEKSETALLSCIHLPLFLWAILGFSFVGESRNAVEKRLGYLKYNGDLIVMTGLILIAGAILTGITINLFELIGFSIKKVYFDYFGIVGLSVAPIIANYLTETNPQLVGKVSPVIARIFSPLVLVMLVIFLIAIVYSVKSPYNDREFLMIFNGLLLGVMAIIFFSVAGSPNMTKRVAEIWILFLLSVVTIIVNGIVLSAILLRISEWGVSPNRIALLGLNVIILINLILVTLRLFKVVSNKEDINGVGKAIASYLPVYCVWTIVVTFLFPLIFGFK